MKTVNGIMALTLLVVAVGYACRPALYSEQLKACVKNSRTLAESQECRCNVSKSFNRPCDPVIALDAGKIGETNGATEPR